MLVSKTLQVTAAGARRIDPETAHGYWVISALVGNSRLDDNDVQLCRIDTLTAPLAKIKRRGLVSGQQDFYTAMLNDSTRAHLKEVAAHGGKVALLVFKLEVAVAA